MAIAEEVIVNLVVRTQQMERGLSRAASAFKGFIAGASTLALAREFLQLADAAKSIDAQLRLATQTFGTFNQAQEDSRRIAAATRSGLAETAGLYGNFTRATQQLGGTQDQAARATETFSKALKIGGADANAAASATLQFGQALASGALRGDEFNSIAEASPRILRLIADAVGVTQGEVRGLASEGKLTSDVLFKALTDRRFTAGIDSEFQQLPVTFDQAMGQVKNAAIITFGAFDQGGEFSTALSNFVTGGANGFADLEGKALEFGQQTRAILEGLHDVFEPLRVNGNSVFDALGIRIFSVSEQIKSLLGSLDNLYNTYARANNFGTRIENAYTRAFNGVTGANIQQTPLLQMRDSAGQFAGSERRSLARSRLDASVRRLEGQGFIVPRNADGTIDEANIRRRETVAPRRAPAAADAKKKGRKGRSAESIALEAEREQQSYDNDLANINDRILDARQALATASDTIAQFERDSIEIQRAKYNDQQNSLVEQKRRTREQADNLIALNNEQAELRKQLVDRNQREREFAERQAAAQRAADARIGGLRNEADVLQSQASLAQTTAERKIIELRLVDIAYEQEKASLEALVATQESVIANRDATAAQVEAARAEKAAAEARLKVLPTIRDNERAGVERQSMGRYERYRENLSNADSLSDSIDNIKIDALEAVTDELTEATKAAFGLKGAFGDIVGELIRIGIQRKLIGPVADALFGKADGTSGSGAVGGIFKSIFGGRASGGHVQAGKIYKINENGPELFQPAQSGKIYPTGSIGRVAGGRGNTIVQQSFTLDARYGITTPQLLQHVNVVAAQKAQQAGQAAYEASPRRSAQLQSLGN